MWFGYILVAIIVLLGVAYASYLPRIVRRYSKPLSLSDNVAVASVYINLVVLVVALVSVLYAIASYDSADQSATAQLKALEAARVAIVNVGERQQKTLDDSRDALADVVKQLGPLNAGIAQSVSNLTKLNAGIKQTVQAVTESATTSRNMDELLQSQLAVQKQQWEKENQRPAILVMTSIEAPLSPGGVQWRELTPYSTLSTGHLLGGEPSLRAKTFFVRNVGNDWLRKTRIMANVVWGGHFECVTYSLTPIGTQDPCELGNMSPPDLPPDTDRKMEATNADLRITVYFSVPKNVESKNVAIYFSVSGENLVGGDTYSVTADLP